MFKKKREGKMTERLKKALEFATRKHKGQFRRGGEEYITHPMAVEEIIASEGFGEDYRIAALFHDLLEDTDATEEEILNLGGEGVLTAVKLLTKTEGYVMAEYIAGIKEDPIAKAVKAADRLHNLRSCVVCDDNFKRRYINESLEWYLDFDPEIKEAVKVLNESMTEPMDIEF